MWFQLIAVCLLVVSIQSHPVAVSHQARWDDQHGHHDHHDHHGFLSHHDHHDHHGHHDHHDHDHLGYGYGHWDHHHHHPSYKFSYSVDDHHTHDHKSQSEWRHGDVVKGHYAYIAPAGHDRVVHYAADDHTGFHANYHFKTAHVHPHHHHHGHHHHDHH